MSVQSMEINTIGTESLRDLYLQFLTFYQEMYVNYPESYTQEIKDFHWNKYHEQIRSKYNLMDIKIMDELAKIDMEYRISTDSHSKDMVKKGNKYEIIDDLNRTYNSSLVDSVYFIENCGINNPQIIFNYFTLVTKYEDISDSNELLESIYNNYFVEHLDDMKSIFEFYKLLKNKGMPDAKFKEVFGDQIINKIKNFLTNHFINLTMSNTEESSIKKRKN
jgi:hypothetical protein